ncbi:DUF835 domain-containing protein [bacterium]|nr:DUF835 domain-containing protein [bacterium]
MDPAPLISIFTVLASILAIFLAISIFRRVYQEDYKRPWLYIGITGILFGLGKIIFFLNYYFSIILFNQFFTDVLIYVLEFVSILFLAYALFLEFIILKFFKGKFVKMRFIPVQEEVLVKENLDLNVSRGFAYISVKKDQRFVLEQFSKATRIGFEGFLLSEMNPKEIRLKYGILKTPIAWINDAADRDSPLIKSSLDESSDIVDPLQINNIVSFIDNFLEQSQNPFIMMDLDLILVSNSFGILEEFLKYIASKVQNRKGILILNLNRDLTSLEKNELFSFLKELE